MTEKSEASEAPEHNKTGQDFGDQSHFHYAGPPIIDVHAHVFQTRPTDPKDGPPSTGPGASTDQAEIMLQVAKEFHIGRIYSMCPADDMPVLRERFGDQLGFNGSIVKKLDEPDEVAYQLLDRYLELGVSMLKLWSAPRGRERGLFVDAPWRIEAVRRAQAAGIRIVMVHVADPDTWFRKVYTDVAKFGTKEDQYKPFERMMQLFPDLTWIGAHMGGDPEHADHLEALLERYPNLHFDTSAAKWQIREVSAHRNAIRSLICRKPDRFLFGSDLVTRHGLGPDHYASRYWSHRTLWESNWEGPSPIADPDFEPAKAEQKQPTLRGLNLPDDVLRKVYYENAKRLLG
ncbi:MAG TPA: amidohydrolase family protein [Gemmataceae bacterium]|nr:amidohydrolase family protein [Gemmataceae bacterium]